MTKNDTQYLIHNKTDTGLHTIIFNRPEAMNALSLETMATFADVVKQIHADDNARVVVLYGSGERAFCSGGDLVELQHRPSADDARQMITTMGDALLMLERLPIPVIAGINGYALGGGAEIALACDMRIADEKAKMAMVQINMAHTTGWGAGQRLMRAVGYSKAMQILVTGQMMRAEELKSLNLINEIVSVAQAPQRALELAQEIAERPPKAVRGIKQLLQAGLQNTYDEALSIERDLFPPLWADQPHLDAVANFFERQSKKRQK